MDPPKSAPILLRPTNRSYHHLEVPALFSPIRLEKVTQAASEPWGYSICCVACRQCSRSHLRSQVSSHITQWKVGSLTKETLGHADCGFSHSLSLLRASGRSLRFSTLVHRSPSSCRADPLSTVFLMIPTYITSGLAPSAQSLCPCTCHRDSL